jgi:hypothetical protein
VIVQGGGGSRTAKKVAGALVVLLLGAVLLAVLFVGGRLWWVSLRGPEALAPTSAAAGSIDLAWDASDDPRVTGYEIRFGIQPGDYPWSEKVGNQTAATLTGLEIGTRYYIVAVAVDAHGNTSDPSNEIEVVVGR